MPDRLDQRLRSVHLAGVDGPHGGDAVATNGLLHDAVVKRLNG